MPLLGRVLRVRAEDTRGSAVARPLCPAPNNDFGRYTEFLAEPGLTVIS